MAGEVKVEGLKELRKALKDVDPELQKQLRVELKKVAEIVATDARSKAAGFSRRAADTIRATSSGDKVLIRGGESKLAWYGWADFGSRTPVSGNPRSVGPWAGSGAGPARGRFIYAALDDKFDEVVQAVDDAVNEATRKAGLQ